MTIDEALHSLGVREDTLTAAEKGLLDERGYLPLTGLMTSAEVSDFRDRLEELAAEEGDEAGLEVHQEEGTLRLSNLIDKDPMFEKIVAEPRVLAAVRHVVGAELKLSSLNARAALPGHGLQGFHADWGPAVDPGDYYVCNSIWMLTDFTADNGATRVVPGSHRSGKRPADDLENPRDEHQGQIKLLAPAGTVVVFNAHLWHAGTQNNSGTLRWAMHGYFTRRSERQQSDQRQGLDADTVRRLSAAARTVVDVGS